MNSRELIEQATARIERMNELMAKIDVIECALNDATDGEVCLYLKGRKEIMYMRYMLGSDTLKMFYDDIISEINHAKKLYSDELEQLLGIQPVPVMPSLAVGGVIVVGEDKPLPHLSLPDAPEKVFPGDRKPATINPEFEALFDDKKPDTVEDKLTDILQKQEQEIKGTDVKPPIVGQALTLIDENSLGSYPAKPKRESVYPAEMTKEVVKEMYVDKGMTINDIAKHFGLSYTRASNFITTRKLHRTHNEKQDRPAEKPQKQPDETERP